MRILVVDDAKVSRLILEDTLTAAGHDVVTAGDGLEAWHAFQATPFTVVISDWMMPDVDGLELCRRIRAQARAQYTYIILLTALEGSASYLEGMRAGADDCLTKPFDRDQLLARLHVAERILGLQARLKHLEGLLPTCMYCKKIRDDTGEWVAIERYVETRSDASFSHGICPTCRQSNIEPEIERAKLIRGQP